MLNSPHANRRWRHGAVHQRAPVVFSEETEPFSELLLHMLGAVAQFERSLLRERQREGIEKAKAKGKYRGRRPSLGDGDIQRVRRLVETASQRPRLPAYSRSAVKRCTAISATTTKSERPRAQRRQSRRSASAAKRLAGESRQGCRLWSKCAGEVLARTLPDFPFRILSCRSNAELHQARFCHWLYPVRLVW